MCSVDRNSSFPNSHRKPRICTDTPWVIVFIIFWCILIVMSVYSIKYGNYLAITNGYDTFGNICGVKHNKRYENFSLSGMDTSKKSYLLFYDNWEISQAVKMCVERCPTKYIHYPHRLLDHSEETRSHFCRYDFNMSALKEQKYFTYMNSLGPCPQHDLLPSTPIRHRCIQMPTLNHAEEIYSYIKSDQGFAQLFFVYIYDTWPFVAALSGIALGISVTLWALFIIPRLVKIMAWLICFMVIVASISLCASLWCVYNGVPINLDDDDKYYGKVVYFLLEDYLVNEKVIYVLAVICSVVTEVIVLVVVLIEGRFSRPSALFKEAASCFIEIRVVMVIPLITLFVLTAFFWIWSYLMLCITTANYSEISSIKEMIRKPGEIEEIYDDNFRSFAKVEYVPATMFRSSLWICTFIVGFKWTTDLICACVKFSLCAAVTNWYYKKPAGASPTHAVGILLRYHLGTVVKESFLTSFIKVPRVILNYLCLWLKKVDRFKGTYETLEKFFGSLNTNAFPVVVREAIGFCSAGRIAWETMQGYPQELEMMNIADVILFFGKVIVVGFTCSIGIILCKGQPNLYFYIAPVTLGSIFAYYIADIVLSSFEMIADTLLLCACEDRNIYEYSGNWVRSNMCKLFDKLL